MKNDEPFLRIQAGKYKGKPLSLPPLEVTRSSKAILRGSFFDTVQFEMVDGVFVEGFAGSGSMGLEALSRGAKKVYFFERDRESFNVLKKNIKKLGVEQSAIAVFGDTFDNFPKYISEFGKEKKLFFYFDPPFAIREGMDEIYEKTFSLISKIKSAKLICLEHQSGIELPETTGIFSLIKTKKFGRSSLTYYGVKDE